MRSMVRFFCPVGVGDEMGARYALALAAATRSVRVFPLIGGMVFSRSDSPWHGHEQLFLAPVTDPYINVVCSGPQFYLGRAIKASELTAGSDKVREQMGLSPLPASDEEVYTPDTALSALHTAGVLNVAITSCKPVYPSAAELAVLCRYDAVVATDPESAYRLIREGCKTAITITPGRAAELEVLLGHLEAWRETRPAA